MEVRKGRITMVHQIKNINTRYKLYNRNNWNCKLHESNRTFTREGLRLDLKWKKKRITQIVYIFIETMQEDLREKRIKMSKVSDNYGRPLSSCYARRIRRKQRVRKQRSIQVHDG